MKSKCSDCGKKFSTPSSLRRHAKKFHADKVTELAPYKFPDIECICKHCGKRFRCNNRLQSHLKKHEKNKFDQSEERKISRKVMKCPLCEYKDSTNKKANLIRHFQEVHDIIICFETMHFKSLNDFNDWKTYLENQTENTFVRSSSSRSEITNYICHRSGYYVSKGTGVRHLKTKGSKKINGFCPAAMKLTKTNNEYVVHFTSTHVGHQNELSHLQLLPEDRIKIATKIACKIPFGTILAEIKDSVSNSKLERLHLLTKKDLYNIEKSFSLSSNSGEEDTPDHRNLIESNIVLEEVSKSNKSISYATFVKEKEIMKQKFLKYVALVENLKSAAQLNVFKQLIAQISPILEIIENSTIADENSVEET